MREVALRYTLFALLTLFIPFIYATELEFVSAVTAGGSVKFLPAV